MTICASATGGWMTVVVLVAAAATSTDPPAIRPFGPPAPTRTDAVPGYVELSDGTVLAGRICLTRGARVKIYDRARQRQREIPLPAIRRIQCAVQREWMEKEWRFKEHANPEKRYTGSAYPAREYVHTITLQDGRQIVGAVSALLYVEPTRGGKRQRFLLRKRHKGAVGGDLKSLTYVRGVRLGEEAVENGRRRATEQYRPTTPGAGPPVVPDGAAAR